MSRLTRRDFGKVSVLTLGVFAPADTPPARTIPLQPVPILAEVWRLRGVTTIRRDWHKGDTARCKLCDLCQARLDSCVVVVGFPVDNETACKLDVRGVPFAIEQEGETR